jgi:hypothetical protein
VTHQHSATGGEGSALKRYLLGRNKVWLVAKNYPRADLWRWLPLVIAYDVAAVGYALAARRDGAALAGRLAGLAGLPRVLRARTAASGDGVGMTSDGAVALLPLLALTVLLWRRLLARRPAEGIGLFLVSLLFFTLSTGLALVPGDLLPRLVVLILLGIDLALLGVAIAVFLFLLFVRPPFWLGLVLDAALILAVVRMDPTPVRAPASARARTMPARG